MPLLPDIPRGYTWSEAHRAACEARLVASLPRAERLDYYERVSKRRGQQAAVDLAAAVKAEYARR